VGEKWVGFMTYDVFGAGALNYAPCRYGNSRILFRGPEKRLDDPYVAFLGGTETYGKFIKAPFPDLIEGDIDANCVNFGISNAGVDVFLHDAMMLDAANGAMATVVQIVGAQNLSNRLYSVHPRRNDRFLAPTLLLSSIYPDVDFSEFHFTRHMLHELQRVSPERFTLVITELQAAWFARMKLFLSRLTGKVVLLWISDHAPGEERAAEGTSMMGRDPWFVTRDMLTGLQGYCARQVEVIVSPEALAAGTDGMVFDEVEAPAAHQMLGPRAHQEAARMLGKALQELV
jgi:hypothetical protein